MTIKWRYIFIAIGVLLLVYGGYKAYGKYQFYKEKSSIVEGQEEVQQMLEKADLEHTQTEDDLRRQLAMKEKEIIDLERDYRDLEAKIKNIVVPTNPGDLADAFRKRGYRSGRVVIRP